MRDSLKRGCSRSSHIGNRGSKQLFNFKRIRCTICLTSPDAKEYHTCRKRTCLLPSGSLVMQWCGKLERKQKKVSGCSVWLHSRRSASSKGSQGQQKRRGKMADNSKAGSFTLLKTNCWVKSVNSDVQSVNIHLKKGSLRWVHGTVLEPPWKSH